MRSALRASRWSFGLALSLVGACAVPGTPADFGRPLGAYRPGEVVVAWAPELSLSAQDGVLAGLGITRLAGSGARQLLAVAPGEELSMSARLRREPGVAIAEPDYIKRTQQVPGSFRPVAPRALLFTPNDPAWAAPGTGQPASSPLAGQLALWDLRAIKADMAWDVTAGSPDVLVATIDTGADMTHKDLVGNLDSKDALNLVELNSPVDDDFGHGTHVAGIIAALGNNNTGVIGVAFRTRVLPIRVLGVDGTGSSYDTVTAIEYAVSHGAKVINMSLGSPDHSDIEASAVKAAIAAGVLLVAASGNEATSGNYEEYPASYPGVVGVAAVGPDLKRANFSNYNSHVTVAAPGVDILSTIPMRMSADPRNAYGYLSGTSMATPIVSGVAALIISQHPTWSAAQVTRQLQVTAKHLAPDGDDSTGANVFFGSGLVDAAAAVGR
jgi:subtilisin family serine protease